MKTALDAAHVEIYVQRNVYISAQIRKALIFPMFLMNVSIVVYVLKYVL